MDNPLNEIHQDIPEIIECPITMEEPNSRIHIYEGDFILKNNETRIEVSGKIEFCWLPRIIITITGTITKATREEIIASFGVLNYDVEINGEFFTKFFLTNYSHELNQKFIVIQGVGLDKAVIGDGSIPVSKMLFSIPNLRSFEGISAKKIVDSQVKISHCRLRFENDKYRITIDRRHKYDDLKSSLKTSGGYILLYDGEIQVKKGSSNTLGFEEIRSCLSGFFSFLNGRRVSLLFLHGIHEGKMIWCDFTPKQSDLHQEVFSWPLSFSIEGLDTLWANFDKLWTDKGNSDFLNTVLHWYLEANTNSGYVEGSIIMVQTGLELIYNWLIIEKKKIIIGKDSEDIQASNKIRLVLSQMMIPFEIPKGFPGILKYSKTNKDILDGPELIVMLRNAIVHSQKDKRKKLASIPSDVRFEALHLSLWYLELAILYLLNYQGKYANRCLTEGIQIDKEQLVPWAVK
ncbi:MAG: hypothetical protein H8E98_04600 [Bacteroidetes bacterium]|nr:hypothetical protein [Bacteroidota bacterium]